MGDIGYKIIAFANTVAKALFNTGYGFITMDVESFSGGNMYNFAKGLNLIFITIGISFATILFLVDFCVSSLDVKNDMRLTNVVKMLLKMGVCSALITYSMDFLAAFIKSENALLNIISGNVYYTGQTNYGAPITFLFSGIDKPVGDMLSDLCYIDKIAEIVSNAKFFESIVYLVFAIIALLVLAGAGLFFIFTGFSRLFKIYTVLPFASFAFATFAARENSAIGSILPGYIKSFLGLLLENAAIVIAIRLFFAFVNSGNSSTFLGLLGCSENATGFEGVMFLLLNAIACYAFFTLTVTAAKDVPKHALSLGNM